MELNSFADDAPSGENLEYDPVFTELEITAQPGQERQMGAEIVAAEEPDYGDIIAKAREVLSRSHDLRAAVYLAHAELRRNGFPGFAEVTGYIRACLTEYWDSCHPQLDEDDDNDPTMRVNAMRGLAAPETILHALRLAPMAKSNAFGMMTLRQRLILDGEMEAHEDEAAPDSGAFSAAFQDMNAETRDEIFGAVTQAVEDVAAIDAVFDEKIPTLGPDLTALRKMLGRIASVIAAETGVSADPVEEDGTDAEGAASPVAAAPVSAPGAISSGKDVIFALDKIIEYYDRNEPSNPVPLLLKRARRLVGADFLTILNDLAPLGLDNVKLVGGIGDAEE
ncbi:type VI secretion system protein TssA [Tropicimonas sp. TH_r6]|uniref:type VI secretion system protein TssA n=1 Tax=Tropicimonas sp. TH_r6 TaxID=3082085 RepID=UPI0029546214|nr:type VI secretion system protein TssA [Tropicimonas sp. TH_r6]MDV7143084.1 type VI secretion system protein TssA [Tropicimonas sp. TH_r6]